MASSTTLKLPEELKARIAPLAKDAGKSAHAWMVEALQERAALAEKRQSFVADALAAAGDTAASGKAYLAKDVHRYILAGAAGKKLKRPKPVNW